MKTIQAITFKRKLVYVAVASCFTVLPAYANPSGATVVNGTVGFATQGNTLNITNTPNAIINWNKFGIQAGEVTRFIQQSSKSAVLNRVVGQDPSQILGSLLSNGRVFLINPNGIVFGAGSTVDVAGLVASTLKLSNGDFLSGKLNFTNGVGAGGIDNQGNISTPAGGNIYLIAPDIKNSGIITSPQGEILLAAGYTVNLLDAGAPDVQVTISAPATQAVNLGTLMAQSGKIGLYAALISQQGEANADTAIRGQNGNIIFKASQNITLEPGSLTTASGMAGGVRDGGEIRIIADGTLAMRKEAEVHVDGGVDGGNGGFLELSGKSIRGFATTSGLARHAGFANGELLIDPTNLYLQENTAAATCSAPGNTCMAPSAGLGFGTVTLTADNDLDINDPILNSYFNGGSAGGSLTLTAGNILRVNAAIGSPGQAFNHALTLNATAGQVFVNAPIRIGGSPVEVNALGATGQIFVNAFQPTSTGNGSLTLRAGDAIFINNSFGSSDSPYDHPLTMNTTTGNITVNSPLWLGSQDFALTAGGNGDIHLNAALSENNIHAGGSLTMTAGNDIFIGNSIGGSTSAGTRFHHNLTLSAGNDIVIADDIWMHANTLALSADSDSNSAGVVGVAGATVDTWGGINIRGAGLTVGYFSSSSGSFGAYSTTLKTTGALDINVSGDVNIFGGSALAGATYPTVVEAGRILAVANNLLLQAGNASAGGVASAELRSTNDSITVTLTGGLTLNGGTVRGAGVAEAVSRSNNSASGAIDLTVASLSLDGGTVISGAGTVNSKAGAIIDGGEGVVINTDGAVTLYAGSADRGSANAMIRSSNGSSFAEILINGAAGGTTPAGDITLRGGSVSASGSANAAILVPNSVPGSGRVRIRGGNLSLAGGSISSSGTVNAYIEGKRIDFALSQLHLRGGNIGSVTGTGTNAVYVPANGTNANANARASIYASLAGVGNNAVVNVSGAATLEGGLAAMSCEGCGSNDGEAGAQLASAGNLTLTAGSIAVTGGTAYAWNSSSSVTANAVADIYASNTLTLVTNGAITVQGGTAIVIDGGSSTRVNATAQINTLSSGDLVIHGLAGATAAAGAIAVRGGTVTVSNGSPSDALAYASLKASSGMVDIRAASLEVRGGNVDTTYSGSAYAEIDGWRGVAIRTPGGVALYGGTGHSAGTSADVYATINVGSGNLLISGLTAGTRVASLTLTGGNMTGGSGSGYARIHGVSQIDANAITLAAGTVTSGNGAQADALINAGTSLVINAAGPISLSGGELVSGVGDVGARMVNSGDTTINNSGPLSLTGGNVTGSNGEALIESIGGALNIALSGATGNLVIAASPTGSGSAWLRANTMNINAGNDITITGSQGAAQIIASGAQLINVGGDLTLTGGAGANAHALIEGNPDVGSRVSPIVVGGVITFTQGVGANAYAQIHSISSSSIYVSFPNLSSGGYTVNGVAVPENNGFSGFCAGVCGITQLAFNPDIPVTGDNLFIWYGLTPPPVTGVPGAVVTAINFYTGETNGSANLNGLIEGIRYGDNKDDNDKPECS